MCCSAGMLLDGWSLVGINGTNGNAYLTIDLAGAVIPADGVFVVATASANAAIALAIDWVANVDWQNGPDAVLQLLDVDQQEALFDFLDVFINYGNVVVYVTF